MGKTQQQQRSGSLQTRLNESPSTKKKKSYDSDHEEVGASGWQSCLVNGLINLSVRSSVGSRRRVTDRKELLCTAQSIFKKIHFPFNPERACMYLNATEAQWRNVQQHVNSDGGIFRRQSAGYATRSRDHVGPVAADTVWFSIQFYTGLNRQRPKSWGGRISAALLSFQGAEYTLSPQREDIFVWSSQLQRSIWVWAWCWD